MAKDMRSYIEQLEKAGELSRVKDEVNVEADIGRRLFASRESALLFQNVKGYPGWSVLGQAPANMRHIAIAFGTEPNRVVREFANRIDKGLVPCKMLPRGPIKDRVLLGDDARLHALPSHVIAEKDPGRYIAGGLCIVKDPETGLRNMAFHRLQVREDGRMGIFMVEGRHTWHIYRKYEIMNKPMPMAVMIGHHPMYYFAAAYTGSLGLDELEVAGALLGEPVELNACETIDVEVPAHAEIVIECEVMPNLREQEGPFSEFTGYYGGHHDKPVVVPKAITMRKDAIYKAVQSAALTESIFYNGLPMAVALFRDLRNVAGYVDLKDVSCNWGSTFNVVVQMTPRFYGEARQVLLAAVSSLYSHQKIAVAVDEDVDIYDPQDVAWAIATRVNPEIDVTVIPGVRGHILDNSLPELTREGITTPHRLGSRMIIDATKPPTCDREARMRFDRVRPPAAI
ncbi:MAG: UbiD family decarboxylase [Burkholderiales bacterium]|nr:UbiD family decarboxylase [Burkholderiales bacterium]